LYAISILLLSASQLGSDKLINQNFPVTFLAHARYVLDGPAVTLFMAIGTILTIGLLKNRNRRFVVTWIVLILAFYLNPLVSPFIIEHITTPNIYWRLFYLLPFPLVIGLSGAAISLRLEAGNTTFRRLTLGVVATILFAAHLFPVSPSVFRQKPEVLVTKLSLPSYKACHLSEARKVLALAPPPGTMLAPPTVSLSLPLLTSDYPQICVRQDGISMFMAERGLEHEATQRIRASYFLGGQTTREGLDSLVWVIKQQPQIRSVVSHRYVAEINNRYLFRLLNKFGFTEYRFADNLVVFLRPMSQG